MITSTSNTKVKSLIQLQKKGRVRKETGLFIVEGLRMFEEINLADVHEIYVSESFLAKEKKIHGIKGFLKEFPAEILSDRVFAHVSETQTPQGILCVVKMPVYTWQDVVKDEQPFLIVLEGLQDPGNVGTIVRTAEGAGVSGILLSEDCVDIYNPKTIRSTMGSIYRMPFLYVEDLEMALVHLKKEKINVYATHLEGTEYYAMEEYQKGTAFLFGNEGKGLSSKITKAADYMVKIPMHGQVESLNVAIAASIFMFEVCRQRR